MMVTKYLHLLLVIITTESGLDPGKNYERLLYANDTL